MAIRVSGKAPGVWPILFRFMVLSLLIASGAFVRPPAFAQKCNQLYDFRSNSRMSANNQVWAFLHITRSEDQPTDRPWRIEPVAYEYLDYSILAEAARITGDRFFLIRNKDRPREHYVLREFGGAVEPSRENLVELLQTFRFKDYEIVAATTRRFFEDGEAFAHYFPTFRLDLIPRDEPLVIIDPYNNRAVFGWVGDSGSGGGVLQGKSPVDGKIRRFSGGEVTAPRAQDRTDPYVRSVRDFEEFEAAVRSELDSELIYGETRSFD